MHRENKIDLDLRFLVDIFRIWAMLPALEKKRKEKRKKWTMEWTLDPDIIISTNSTQLEPTQKK